MDMQLFCKCSLYLHDVYEVIFEFPLYGRTRTLKLTRCISAARVTMGWDPLMHDEKSWEDLLAMHDNVGKALRLFGISDFDDASEACSVLSALIKKSYDPAERTSYFPLDVGAETG